MENNEFQELVLNLLTQMNKRFLVIDKRFEQMDQRFDSIDNEISIVKAWNKELVDFNNDLIEMYAKRKCEMYRGIKNG